MLHSNVLGVDAESLDGMVGQSNRERSSELNAGYRMTCPCQKINFSLAEIIEDRVTLSRFLRPFVQP